MIQGNDDTNGSRQIVLNIMPPIDTNMNGKYADKATWYMLLDAAESGEELYFVGKSVFKTEHSNGQNDDDIIIRRRIPGIEQIDSPPLSEEEIADIKEFYAHPEEHKIMTVEECIKELHEECHKSQKCGA